MIQIFHKTDIRYPLLFVSTLWESLKNLRKLALDIQWLMLYIITKNSIDFPEYVLTLEHENVLIGGNNTPTCIQMKKNI